MTPMFRSAEEAENYLLGFINYEIQTRYRPTTRTHDLERVARILGELGWDPSRVSTVHVGGTNAKGSVCWLVERLLRCGGMRTGLYASPHLLSMRERIRIDGRTLSRDAFRRGVSRMAEAFRSSPGAGFRTTFEHLTALAFLEFQEAKVDWAVIEVGLGGRLDATNILPPGIAVLTPVSLDHQNILGKTVGIIAADKAAILKRGGKGFVMPQPPSARRAIETRASREGVPLFFPREGVQVELIEAHARGSRWRISGKEPYGAVATGLLGSHQRDNLATAVAVAEDILGPGEVRGAVSRGLRGARIPGRLQSLRRDGQDYVLDGGHNPAAARAVAAALRLHHPGRKVTAVVGLARDKKLREYLRALSPAVENWIFTRSSNPRAADPETLARGPVPGRAVSGLEEALHTAKRGRADLVLVAGSFVLVGEALGLLGRRQV